MTPAIWKNGKKEVMGRWHYDWARDRFVIHLDSKDRITGRNRQIEVSGDSPEWGNWKRIK